jgi:hypothetical protein
MLSLARPGTAMHRLPRGHRSAPALVAALLLAAALVAVPGEAVAGVPATVDLGHAAPFVVLAGAGVVAGGQSRVTGDVGAYPRPAISDQLGAVVIGTVHRGGADAKAAQADLAQAYALAADATPTVAGLGSSVDPTSLAPGIYALTGSSVSLRGHVVLDGGDDRDATWIFQVPADLVTTSGSTIDLVNGAQACNVFWQVGGTATFGADSVFAGTVLATTAVTVEAGVTVEGRVLSMTGQVLLGGDTISLPVCTTAAPAAAPVADLVAAGPAVADAPLSSSVAAAGGERRPSVLPIAAIAGLLLLAVLMGEPRRGHRPTYGPW